MLSHDLGYESARGKKEKQKCKNDEKKEPKMYSSSSGLDKAL